MWHANLFSIVLSWRFNWSFRHQIWMSCVVHTIVYHPGTVPRETRGATSPSCRERSAFHWPPYEILMSVTGHLSWQFSDFLLVFMAKAAYFYIWPTQLLRWLAPFQKPYPTVPQSLGTRTAPAVIDLQPLVLSVRCRVYMRWDKIFYESFSEKFRENFMLAKFHEILHH